MESATLPRPWASPERLRAWLIALLLTLAVVAWAVTDERMRGMDAGPGTNPGALGFYLTVWVVMMAAMMFPSVAPMVLMHARVQVGKRAKGGDVPAGVTALFVGGYLLSWTGWGLAAYGLIELLDWLSIDAFSWDRGGPYVAGGVIVAAGLYQLTPLKDACLRRCRSPWMFLMTSWRPGRLGALRMGVQHGGWCVGCCWGLMAALFALGVMSIGWMAFVAALIAIEKLLPWKAVANRGIAVLLLVLGLAVAFAPDRVPGLTLPDSPEAARAMEMMGMEGGEMAPMEMEGEMGPAGAPGGEMRDEMGPVGAPPMEMAPGGGTIDRHGAPGSGMAGDDMTGDRPPDAGRR